MVRSPCLQNIGHAAFIAAAKYKALSHGVMHLVKRTARYEYQNIHYRRALILIDYVIAHIDGDANFLLTGRDRR